ncbi:hypothetical protein C8R47DRAFT_777955 [Mycena vitilis]|nr:hypothetical protein C8R47DRAFT_777955 [Mycena vitilis]
MGRMIALCSTFIAAGESIHSGRGLELHWLFWVIDFLSQSQHGPAYNPLFRCWPHRKYKTRPATPRGHPPAIPSPSMELSGGAIPFCSTSSIYSHGLGHACYWPASTSQCDAWHKAGAASQRCDAWHKAAPIGARPLNSRRCVHLSQRPEPSRVVVEDSLREIHCSNGSTTCT